MHFYYDFGLQYQTSKIKMLQQHEKVFVMFHHLWRWRLNVPRNYTRPRCCSYKLICIIKKDQSAIKKSRLQQFTLQIILLCSLSILWIEGRKIQNVRKEE